MREVRAQTQTGSLWQHLLKCAPGGRGGTRPRNQRIWLFMSRCLCTNKQSFQKSLLPADLLHMEAETLPGYRPHHWKQTLWTETCSYITEPCLTRARCWETISRLGVTYIKLTRRCRGASNTYRGTDCRSWGAGRGRLGGSGSGQRGRRGCRPGTSPVWS